MKDENKAGIVILLIGLVVGFTGGILVGASLETNYLTKKIANAEFQIVTNTNVQTNYSIIVR
jgi:hypothetical protein